MILVAAVLAAAAPAVPEMPAAVTRLLSAASAGDLAGGRATLAESAVIMDARSEPAAAATLESYVGYVRDCRRTETFIEVDGSRAVVTARWQCPSGPTEDFIWTDGPGVVHIQFGLSLAPRR
jgi:hypothetical protein